MNKSESTFPKPPVFSPPREVPHPVLQASILHHCFEFVGLLTPEGTLIEIAEAPLKFGHFSRQEVLGKFFWDTPWWIQLATLEDRQRLKEAVAAVAKGKFERYLVTIKNPNGNLHTFDFSLKPVLDDAGIVKFIVPEGRDITEFEALKIEYEAVLHRYRDLFRYSKDGMAYLSRNFNFIDVNPSFCQMMGYSREELLHEMNCKDLTSPEFHKVEERLCQEVLTHSVSVAYEKIVFQKSGTPIFVEVSAFPVNDPGAEPYAIGVLVRDISKRKQMEQDLRKKNEALLQSNSDLERFASIASHDLKEPLRMIGAHLQLFSRNNPTILDKDSKEFLEYAVQGSIRMQELIDNLLKYSKVGSEVIHFREFNCSELVRTVLRDLNKLVLEKSAEIRVDPLPKVVGEPTQIRQLFQNLIHNALKYHNSNPHIWIGSEEKDSEWVFFVQDDGIGIPSEHKERIFEIFQRLHCRSDYPGTGIGLATCKRIIERHGGRIWAESIPNQGSTFYFTLGKHSSASRS